jgi:DNA-binding protein HU-beta
MGQATEALMPLYNGSRREADKALRLVLGLQMDVVAKGERFCITGWGTLEPVVRSGRLARNPQTGERIQVDESWSVKWRVGASFHAIINGAKELERDSSGYVVFKESRIQKEISK